MARTVALSKILDIRENEKKIAQKAYHQSMDSFEKIATELYTLLRKKENAEVSYDRYIHSTAPIDMIKEQAVYIERLNTQINELQKLVQKARNDMDSKQVKLSDAHIEVKKFERIIENRNDIEEKYRKKVENNFMDEISITQYLSHKNR
ncbi:flagellar export protein FliJ [Oceanobacillus saliphilus]|uniref:flagellar export protein FliJ n=1 Tax=Oceanobacillus saliphilus TaxID=2925834 RepID=UPI00201D4715|nr:flagellar export protein FliJ [Oceanobacillus saliphilus]